MPGFSTLAKPLSDLTRKDTTFEFTCVQRDAFNDIKDCLCSEPVLHLFDFERETELHTDASKWGYGAVLMQKKADSWHPVLYLSKKTTPSEQNLSSYELEVLAIISALKKLRVYLLGLCFTIVTDCKAFNQTMSKRDLCYEFDCKVVHRSGTSMRHVDALSRHPVVCELKMDNILERIRSAQIKDSECKFIEDLLKQGVNYKDFVLRLDLATNANKC